MTKDDLDKAKNTNAVELASLTAMGLGEGDPYPVWKKDDKGAVVLDKDGKPAADPFVAELQARRRRQRRGHGARTRPRLTSTPAPVRSWRRMDSVPS